MAAATTTDPAIGVPARGGPRSEIVVVLAPGVRMMAEMSAFDYLTLRPDTTARPLIAPAIHEFVTRDAAEDAILITTLRAYGDCDLNARLAADRLHIHVAEPTEERR